MGGAERDGTLPIAVTWISISEAARRLGVSRAAIYGRIKRGTATAKRSNTGPEVQWPLPEIEHPLRHGDMQPYIKRDVQGDVQLPVMAVELIGELRAERDAARVEATVLHEEVTKLRERVAYLEGKTEERDKRLDELQDERNRERARADRLESEARRPWWRKLFDE